MRDLIVGVRSVFTAMRLIATDARVRRLAIAPMLINVALVVLGVPLLLWLGGAIGSDLVPGSAAWEGALRALVAVVAAVVVAIAGIVILLVVARIAAAPLMGRLAEAVERAVLGERFVERRATLRDGIADAGRGAAFALGRLLLFLLLYPPILLLGLLPGIGAVLAPACSLLYGAFVLSLDFSEPVFERHLRGFRRRVGHILRRPLLYLGFGGAAVAMALVPLANLVVLPVCVAAATIVFLGSERGDRRV